MRPASRHCIRELRSPLPCTHVCRTRTHSPLPHTHAPTSKAKRKGFARPLNDARERPFCCRTQKGSLHRTHRRHVGVEGRGPHVRRTALNGNGAALMCPTALNTSEQRSRERYTRRRHPCTSAILRATTQTPPALTQIAALNLHPHLISEPVSTRVCRRALPRPTHTTATRHPPPAAAHPKYHTHTAQHGKHTRGCGRAHMLHARRAASHRRP